MQVTYPVPPSVLGVSSGVANLLIAVNYWLHILVAWVVGRLSGDIAVALTLPSPLLRTRPYVPIPDKPSLGLHDGD